MVRGEAVLAGTNVVPEGGKKKRALSFVLVALATMVAVGVLHLTLAAEPAEAAFPGQNGKIAYHCCFVSAYGHNSYDIYTISPGESTPTKLTDSGENYSPVVSPDGRTIAYRHLYGDIYTIPATGGEPTPVLVGAGAGRLSWSPDGKTIAYDGWNPSRDSSDIYTVPASGEGTPTQLTDTDTAEEGPTFSPSSTNGTKIAYYADDGTDSEIYTIPAVAGGTPTKVTDNTGIKDYLPAWSPKGDKIAYQVVNDGIYTTSASGGGTPTKVTDGSSPAWSPDGTRIAYEGFCDSGTLQICTIPSTGGTPTNVTQNTQWNYSPDWGVAPDTTAPTAKSLVATNRTTTGVPRRNTNFLATFSEKMNRTTLNKSTYRLYRCPTVTSTNCTTQIPATVVPSADGLSAVLNPYGATTGLLAANTRYKVVATPGAKDAAGNALDQNPSASGSQQKVSYFKTGSS